MSKWLRGRKAEHTGIIVGNDAAGKTTMLYQLKLKDFVQAIPTIGFNTETIDFPKGRRATICDVGGCDKMRPMVRHYIHANHFILFVHDCADRDPERLQASLEYLHLIAGIMSDVGARNMWIVFNKQDLLPPAERDEMVADLRKQFEAEMAQYRDRLDIKVMDTPGFSAMTGEQVNEVMDEIFNSMEKERKPGPSPPPPKKPDLETGPSDEELREQIKKANADGPNPDDFWKSFLEGLLPAWDHYTHLRAGFFVMYDCLARGCSTFECADEFMSHLNRLRAKDPERFRNTTHKTMTVFWLVQLRLAAVAYQTNQAKWASNPNLVEFPTPEEFANIALFSPQLMNSGLWKAYYSKDVLFSPGARQDWHPPDLQPLPTIASKDSPTHLPLDTRSPVDPNVLPSFAFTVIQKTLQTQARRGAVVKHYLETLESSTIQVRAWSGDGNFPPYSETQAYFWIQFTHAALKSLERDAASTSQTTEQPRLTGPITAMTYPAFKALFNVTGEEWREYYTPATWEAISSRLSFVVPDKKPLPNVFPRSVPRQCPRVRN